jgi:hypothetical protein
MSMPLPEKIETVCNGRKMVRFRLVAADRCSEQGPRERVRVESAGQGPELLDVAINCENGRESNAQQ